jgi:hypothetical protein
MDWRRFPSLTQRRSIPAPRLSALPQLEDSLHENAWPRTEQLASPYIDPDFSRLGSTSAAPGAIRKAPGSQGERVFAITPYIYVILRLSVSPRDSCALGETLRLAIPCCHAIMPP